VDARGEILELKQKHINTMVDQLSGGAVRDEVTPGWHRGRGHPGTTAGGQDIVRAMIRTPRGRN